MMARLNLLAQNWTSRSLLLTAAIVLAVFHLGLHVNGGEQEFSVEEFNQLPREFRIGYLKTGASKRKLGPNAKVDDLVDELLRGAERAQDAKEKRGMAFALLAVRDTPHSNEQVVSSCKNIADDLLESSYSRAAVEVYYELLGDESLPYLIEAIKHNDTATQIQAAKRLGYDVGTPESISKLQEAIEREEAGGSETVAKYLREAVKLIEERYAKNQSIQALGVRPQEADAVDGGVYPTRKSESEVPAKESNDTKKLSLPLVVILSGLVFVAVYNAARTRKSKV